MCLYLRYGARLSALPAYHDEHVALAERGNLFIYSPQRYQRSFRGDVQIFGETLRARDQHLVKRREKEKPQENRRKKQGEVKEEETKKGSDIKHGALKMFVSYIGCEVHHVMTYG